MKVYSSELKRLRRVHSDLLSERDKFLKDLQKTRYCDWIIHKKLLDGGGLGRTIYIHPARAEGKYFTQLELYKKFIEDDREIRVVKAYEKPVNLQKFKEVVLDRDLYLSGSINQYRADALDEYLHESMRKYLQKERENWKPIIRTTSSVCDDPYTKHWLWDVYMRYGSISKGVSDETLG